MNEQYYRIMLNDYAKPAFVTFDKAYYGSLQQVRTFIEALEQDKRTKRNHEPLIKLSSFSSALLVTTNTGLLKCSRTLPAIIPAILSCILGR